MAGPLGVGGPDLDIGGCGGPASVSVCAWEGRPKQWSANVKNTPGCFTVVTNLLQSQSLCNRTRAEVRDIYWDTHKTSAGPSERPFALTRRPREDLCVERGSLSRFNE